MPLGRAFQPALASLVASAKPYTQNQDVTICTEVDPVPGVTVVVEGLNTPRGT